MGIQSYSLEKKIGQGAYGAVKKGTHLETDCPVAVKVYEKYKLVDSQRKRSVMREIKILQKLSHPNIITLFEAFDSPKQVFLVTEFVDGMPLNDYTKRKFSSKCLPEIEVRLIGRDLLRAVAHLHENNIFHRDIKMENILVSKTKCVKLIDFGFSILSPKKRLRLFCGTPSYMSPEIVLKKEYRGGPADVWAIAVVLFTIYCGSFPFRSPIERELYRKITKGLYVYPHQVSPIFKRIID